MASLRATTRAAGFFFVLQYIPASDEGSLDEEEEEDFYEEANREGDDEGEKNKNWELNGVHCLGIFRPNVVGVDLLQTNGAILFLLGTGITHKMSKVLVTFYVRVSGGGDTFLYLVAAKTSIIKTKGYRINVAEAKGAVWLGGVF